MTDNPQERAVLLARANDRPAGGPAKRRRRRVARGPVVIGESGPTVQARLAVGDPYRPDTVIDGGVAFGVAVRAASVRGLGKRWAGGPRQDDICLGRHEPTHTLIAAVADGVSGAERSHLGAALAVRHAVAGVKRALDAGAELDWHEVFGHAAWALVEAERAAAADPDAGVAQAARALATTLLVAVVRGVPEENGEPGAVPASRTSSSALVELACVGDSCALRLHAGRYAPLLGDQPDDDLLLGAPVSALPRAAHQVRTAQLELCAGDVLLLASDGFCLPLAGGENDVGAFFARELDRPPGLIEFGRLLDFSRSTYDDDRTLVAIWPPQGIR